MPETFSPAIKPIRPVERQHAFDDPEWIFELKHDGVRALAYVENGQSRLVSRNNYTFPHWPGLGSWLGNNLGDFILDGELVCLDEQGRSQFYDLFFRRKEPIYYAFDLLWLNGEDLRDLPLVERKARLKELVPEQPSPILYADHVPETGVKLFHKICEMDLEGIVAKRKTAPYREKTLWIKIRNPNYSQKEGRAELFQARWR